MAEKAYNKVVVNGQTIIDLTEDTVDAAHLGLGLTAHGKNGVKITGTGESATDTQDATAEAGDIILNKTAYVRGSKVTGTMPDNGTVTGEITDINTPYIIPAGKHSGTGTVKVSDADKEKLLATNIRQGVTILGVEGTMTSTEGVNAQAKTVTPTFSQQQVVPDSGSGYNYLSSVTVSAIPVNEEENEQGGKTITVG